LRRLVCAKLTLKLPLSCMQALSRFRHPNIAALFAYTDPTAEGASGGYHLVYELAEKGSLENFLRDDLGRSRLGSFQRRVQVAIDVLTAIRFLHEGSKGVASCFHRDIKPANIVIKRDFTAQLIDCGLAKFVNDRITTTGVKGTRGYICPQYVKTGKYLAACDIYSYGVVLLELWTGRLQNHEDESEATFNFGEEYIYGEREVNADVDAATDLADPLPAFSKRYSDLALRCINERIKNRPTGVAVLNELKDILVECSLSTTSLLGSGSPSLSEAAESCSNCRTMPIMKPHEICALCLFRKEIRKEFANIVVVNQAPEFPAMDALQKQIEDLSNKFDPTLEGLRKQMEDMNKKLDLTLPVMAQLDRRLNNQIPRTFFLLPGDIKSGWKHPRSWLRSKVQKKYYLFFVCPVSQQAVSPPIKLKVAKDWVGKIAPVLAMGLYLLQMSIKAGLNVSLDLDGVASDLFQVSSSHVSEMIKELSAILDESDSSRGLLDRLRAQQLSEGDVHELSGDAYELVIEKASEQNGWRSAMEPVRAPPSPKVFWVAKAVASNPQYEFEVVQA
jgi:serine/threonine protein kinase